MMPLHTEKEEKKKEEEERGREEDAIHKLIKTYSSIIRIRKRLWTIRNVQFKQR